MKTSDPKGSHLKFVKDQEVKRKQIKTDEFGLLLDRYLDVEKRLVKELEYGRLVRNKVKLMNNELEKQRTALDNLEGLCRKQKIRIESLEKKIINAQTKLEHSRNTISFQLGYKLIQASKSWKDLVRLPSSLLALRREAVMRRQQNVSTKKNSANVIGVADSLHEPTLVRGTEKKPSIVIAPKMTHSDKGPSVKNKNIDELASKSDRNSSGSDTGLDEIAIVPEVKTATIQADIANASPLTMEKASVLAETPTNIDSQTAFDTQYLASLAANLKKMRMACIMDEFTFHSFANECDLVQLHAESWKQEITTKKPDLLFLESAWKGLDNSWAKKISDISSEAQDLIDYCKKSRIPIVFWNKEDPFHFGRFLPIAKQADVVFTTDVDCIEKYKFKVGHDRVYLLPFAAQPASHNPIETFERKDAFSFAGSFYLRYPERQRDFDNIYEVGRELKSVDIYDRNFENPHPHLKFPEKYDASIIGSLPVSEIDKAYKGYKFGINMNTIKYSQTMFARRVYELMASNTIVVSNFSRGLRTLFGDLVISSDARSELHSRLKRLCDDETYYRKFRLLGLRKVLSEHTYSHRLVFILSKIIKEKLSLPQPKVAIIARVQSQDGYARLLSNYENQQYKNKILYVVGSSTLVTGVDPLDVNFVADSRSLVACLSEQGVKYVAPFSNDDFYGKNYLVDLVLATSYGDFDAVGKAAYYTSETNSAIKIVNDGEQYHFVNELYARCSLIPIAKFKYSIVDSFDGINNQRVAGKSLFSVDEFNYCRNVESLFDSQISELVCDLKLDNQGLNLEETIYKIVDTIKPSSRGVVADSAEKLPGISAQDLYSYLPKKIANTLKFSFSDGKLSIQSTLEADKHRYIYLTRLFTKSELNFETNNRFQLLCNGESSGDFRTIYVFLDENGEKIEHAMNKVGAAYSITIPKNCRQIKLGFRFQGPGSYDVERLILGDLREKPAVLLTNSSNLVLTKQYPEYSDLYRYGFLHSRVKEYKAQNLDFEVFKISEHVNIEYREFEGIDVLSSDYHFLDSLLQQNSIKKIIVHFIDHKIWNVLKKYVGSINIYIWIHGAEIQPWFRRAVRFESQSSLAKAKKASDVAQQMWLEIFEAMSEKLRLIFVSEYLANEVQNDLGCRLDRNFISIIPNYINNNFFAYVEKNEAARRRILSIRPYASMIYGNDLSVKAVQILAKEPFFNDFEFKFVGDGPMFESTLEPIKDFANVTLQKGFVTQSEIAALHREYGVFLVPSRMDTQGVSRDEAMSSGLVPVTSRVAAIPDFVDENCALLAAPENAFELAEGIKTLYLEPAKYLTMSAAAAKQVRTISGYEQTIAREIKLIKHGEKGAYVSPFDLKNRVNIALYGDVNLNLTDGSAIWAISLAETLAGVPDVYVTVFLKARIKNTHIISPLFNLSRKVRIVEPKIDDKAALTPRQALESIESEQSFTKFDGVILRGLELCNQAVEFSVFQDKIWCYITDLPQQKNSIDEIAAVKLNKVFSFSKFVLCQTQQFKYFIEELFPQTVGKTKILSPMIPKLSILEKSQFEVFSATNPLRIVYAGKFAPLWGIREMFKVFRELKQLLPHVELHVFGDKVHNPPDDPTFKSEVLDYLNNLPGVIWYKAVPRETVMAALADMHIGWAYRDPLFEKNTRELSTKVLEYASMGLPVMLSRNDINYEVFGEEYPLFASNEDEAYELLVDYTVGRRQLKPVIDTVISVSERFTFSQVQKNLMRQGLFE